MSISDTGMGTRSCSWRYGFEDLPEDQPKSVLIAERVLAPWSLRPEDVLLVDDDPSNCADARRANCAVVEVAGSGLVQADHTAGGRLRGHER